MRYFLIATACVVGCSGEDAVETRGSGGGNPGSAHGGAAGSPAGSSGSTGGDGVSGSAGVASGGAGGVAGAGGVSGAAGAADGSCNPTLCPWLPDDMACCFSDIGPCGFDSDGGYCFGRGPGPQVTTRPGPPPDNVCKACSDEETAIVTEDLIACYPSIGTYGGGITRLRWFGRDGFVVLTNRIETPGAPPHTGLLYQPSDDGGPGTWHCAEGEEKPDGDYGLRLKLLGACPGAPAIGNAELCYGDASPVGFCPGSTEESLQINVEGVPYEFEWGGSTSWHGLATHLDDENGGFIIVHHSTDGVARGLMMPGSDHPNQGVVYCFDGGTVKIGDRSNTDFFVGNSEISRLGHCGSAPLTGEACSP